MIEYRVSSNVSAESDKLQGLVTPFGSQTTIGDLRSGGFREQIAPGAFSKTLQERDVVLLFNHNSDMPLARKSAGNLSLQQTQRGLECDATPVDTSYGRDLLSLTRSGVVKGMSFGFEVVNDDWLDDAGNPSDSQRGTQRTIREVKLHEVSAVTFPAYQDTTLSARSEDQRSAMLDQVGSARRYADVVAAFESRKDWSAGDRKKAAADGSAMPDGSFPIKDAEDLQNAIHLAGNASDPAAARKHIMARAKALGLSDKIPDNWKADGSNSDVDIKEQRDVIDGDDPNAGPYNLWSNGAIQELANNMDQVPENYRPALQQILNFIKGLAEHEANPKAPATEQPKAVVEQNSQPEDDWALRAQAAYAKHSLAAVADFLQS